MFCSMKFKRKTNSPDNDGKSLVGLRRGDPICGGAVMTEKRRKPVLSGLPTKRCWHLYSLQNLQTEKLAKIVNKILKKEYVLIK